jgi:hypothetical protein
MKRHLIALTVVAAAVVGLGASRWPTPNPVEHLTAKVGIMTSSARLALRPIDIVIWRWSMDTEHRALETTLLEKGWVTFLDQLCTFTPVGSIATIDGRDIAIRYAWQAVDRDGLRRIFIATDEPITLASQPNHRPALADSFVFLEVRITRSGDGEGKFSEAARLFVDESRDVIELRDYADRPLHLVMVRSLQSVEECPAGGDYESREIGILCCGG